MRLRSITIAWVVPAAFATTIFTDPSSCTIIAAELTTVAVTLNCPGFRTDSALATPLMTSSTAVHITLVTWVMRGILRLNRPGGTEF